VFIITFGIAFSSLEKLGGLGPHGDLWLHMIQVVGVLGAIGSLYAILAAVVTWGDKQQWVWYRVWNLLLAFARVGFFWFAYHWHMFNFNLRY
jgi:hypothetical protein